MNTSPSDAESKRKARVLFLSLRHACRSRIAEAVARRQCGPDVEVMSAGLEPAPVYPEVAAVLAEAGLEPPASPPVAVGALPLMDIDVVVTMGADCRRACAVLPGSPACLHWGLEDPLAGGGGAGALDAARALRERVSDLVGHLLAQGFLAALVQTRQLSKLVVDNITEGLIAHDLERRILLFNRAAEEITGYRAAEVLNRSCSEVFPGGFCGGKCVFDALGRPVIPDGGHALEIVTRSGERREAVVSVKPMTDEEGRTVGILSTFRDVTHQRRLERRLGEIEHFAGLVGRDPKMIEVFELIRDLADSTVPVLIQGESGTGKELIAAAIHNEGPRAKKAFVPVNCGALPEGLLESELFGHVRGAFTGAVRDKKGRFELADGGTIFLDEIGDLSPAMQVKLLRVLQEGTFERVGGEATIRVDVRLISATNKRLAHEMAAGRFRDDLYYRLSVMPLHVPPLRERRLDIPPLAEHVLRRALADSGRTGVTISPEAMDRLLSHDWPGNVRELQNWLTFALVKCKGAVIQPEHLPPAGPAPAAPARPKPRGKLDAESVRKALAEAGGSKVEAARLLGVARATLYRFLEKEGLAG